MDAVDPEPGQESYKTPEQFKDHTRKWARFFGEVHHDEVTVFFASIAFIEIK